MTDAKKRSMSFFLNPKSIAIIGATDNPDATYGRFLSENLIGSRIKREIFLINPKYKELFGLPCYASIEEIGKPVDLVAIVVNAKYVEEMVKRSAACGCRACLIISAGFGEVSKEGKAAEARLKQIAQETGMHIVGPNTVGAANLAADLWLNGVGDLACKNMPYSSGAVVCQSGGVGFGALLNPAIDRRYLPKYLITTGNEADLSVTDFAEYILDDEDVEAVSILIEGIKDGKALLDLAMKAYRLGKKLIILKLGESEVGARAALSHTASMTGDMVVFNAMAKQYGIIKAEDYDELVEYLKMNTRRFRIQGRRLCAISGSGGVAGFLGDQLGKHGFEVPRFKDETINEINAYLKGFGSPRNPLDMTARLKKDDLIRAIEIIEKNEEMDGYVIATHGSKENAELVLRAFEKTQKPCYIVWTGSMELDGLDVLRTSQYPISFSIPKFSKELMNSFESYAARPVARSEELSAIDVSQYHSGYLNETASKQLIHQAGLDILPSCTVSDWSAFEQAGGPSFEGPYAMKVLSDTIIHKSDVGGVALGLHSLDELKEAYDVMMQRLKNQQDEVQGVLIEQMAPDGLDVMLGSRVDPQLGPIVLVGLGGIYTELFKAVSVRLAPVAREEILRMIDDLPPLKKMLGGYRGQGSYDQESLIKTVERFSAFVYANRESISVAEINPLRVLPHNAGTLALDCVIQLTERKEG